MTIPKADRITFDMVERKVGDGLIVDDQVQRTLKQKRVDAIAKEFNPAALGVLTTSWRSAKRIHIVDGQHRYAAAVQVSYTGVIRTMEYRGLTLAEEAALFRMLNDAEKVARVDAFTVACVEQVPSAVHLAEIMAANGWSVSAYSGQGRLTAIAALERVYALSPKAAASTLGVLTGAFGHQPSAVQGALLEGVGKVLARYEEDIDHRVDTVDLARRLSDWPGGPDSLVGHARGQRASSTGSLATQVARVVVNRYNERRRSTKLPAWE